MGGGRGEAASFLAALRGGAVAASAVAAPCVRTRRMVEVGVSWPSDGGPRFVVVSTSGYLNMVDGGSSRVVQPATFAVLDRAFCHREVTRFRSEDQFGGMGSSRSWRNATAQAKAEARASELNGEHLGLVA